MANFDQHVSVLALVRVHVLTRLRTYAFPRLWLADFPDGAAPFVLAALLHEGGLRRARIFATMRHPARVEMARLGCVPARALSRRAFGECGAALPFDEYFLADEDVLCVRPALARMVTFAEHHLGEDGSFGEFQVILTAGALAGASPEHRGAAREVLHASLCPLGVLALSPDDRAFATPPWAGYRVLAGDALHVRLAP